MQWSIVILELVISVGSYHCDYSVQAPKTRATSLCKSYTFLFVIKRDNYLTLTMQRENYYFMVDW